MAEGIIVRRGGGAGGVDFSIVGGATQPSSPKENMIWINTETPIGAVSFSAARPISATLGDVWIAECKPFSIGINIGGKNTMMFYISKCYQYDSEKFVEIPGMIYRSGAWAELHDYALYAPGDEKGITTGGWLSKGMKSQSDSGASAKETPISSTEQYLLIDSSEDTGSDGACILYAADPIDLTDFKSLVFEGDFTRGGTSSATRNLSFCAWSSFPSYYYVSSTKAAGQDVPGTTATMITVDVSSLNGFYYVGCGATYSIVKLTNCYLIPKDA